MFQVSRGWLTSTKFQESQMATSERRVRIKSQCNKRDMFLVMEDSNMVRFHQYEVQILCDIKQFHALSHHEIFDMNPYWRWWDPTKAFQNEPEPESYGQTHGKRISCSLMTFVECKIFDLVHSRSHILQVINWYKIFWDCDLILRILYTINMSVNKQYRVNRERTLVCKCGL